MDEDEISTEELDLKEDPKFLSPPYLDTPLYQCAIAVTALGFVPHALLEIEVDGAIVASQIAGFPAPNGETVQLPAALMKNQTVRARQTVAGATSDWSPKVTVGDHTQDYPAGPPRPQINPAPVLKCGLRTGVSNLLVGCNVWITADGVQVGDVKGAKEHQGVNVDPAYGLGQKVRAWASLCDDPSPPSVEHVAQAGPSPLPTPSFDPVYDGQEQVRITGLANGARFEFFRGGVSQGIWRTWGQAHLVDLSPAFHSGEHLSAKQMLCPGDDPSDEGGTDVLPCSQLPAPKVAPVQAGDMSITIVDGIAGARIRVFRNGIEIGDSSGVVIPLSVKVADGDTLYVIQSVGNCTSQTARIVHVHCVAPHVSGNPAGLDLFPVGQDTYDGGTVTIDGDVYNVKGTVFYPAEDDGVGQPFRERLAKLGPAPIVFMAHGNHYTFRDPADHTQESCGDPGGWEEIPNHEGYDYLQMALARMGIVAVGVYSNQTNCQSYSATNMHDRAELLIASIAHFQALAGDPASNFFKKIDFSRIGLMGHSRGAEAVVVVPEIISLPGATIAGVLSLAPTNAGASSGEPKAFPFMTILPAGDGDVVDNPGARFYDKATPDEFKCQVFAHHTNHNFFNRQWPGDDSRGPPVLSRVDHEKILLAFGCAFFRKALLKHFTTGYLTGGVLAAGVSNVDIHLSFEWTGAITVDHHEDGNGIAKNSFGAPTTQLYGLSADEYAFAQMAAPAFNASFFGNSIGMVAKTKKGGGTFRSEFDKSRDLKGKEIWLRAAEVYNGSSVPAGATGFELGLEDSNGTVAWVNSDSVGGVLRPYDRRADDLADWPFTDLTKTMLKTVRFRAECFKVSKDKFLIDSIVAVQLRLNHGDKRALAFDMLQIV